MLESATYLVTKEIAIRSGLIDSRHRIADGRFVLNDRDLSRIRLTADEYITGLTGVEKITSLEAKTLIRQNDFALGSEKEYDTEIISNESESESETEENSNEKEKE